ncbi:MAG: hypothetical protein FJ206_06345 [Gemmatimonadetes bacterium]|nr:hypothetical protein [Gemmatimonadota bacterium]
MALTRSLLAAAVAASLPPTVAAQVVRGAVLADSTRTPIVAASVTSRRSGTAASTDRLGRFRLETRGLPDTLVVAAIGYHADTVVATSAESVLTVLLARAPVALSDLIATASVEPSLDLSNHGRWQMPIQAARTVPPAVETDVYRALALVPAVSFTSPLSARPMVRGYDAQEVVTRIDGFEVLNLFHLGRVFSSFPADAAEDIGLTAAPYTSANGGSVAGLIDITGRTGPVDRTTAGGGFSFGSFSAFAGGGSERVRYFGTGRLFHLGTLRFLPGVDIPYHFEDFYGSVVFGPSQRPKGRITLFATQDRAGNKDDDDNGFGRTYLDWDNLVAGTRWRLLDRARTTLELSAAAASFREQGERIPAVRRFSTADIRNRFARVSTTLDLARTTGSTRVAVGVAAGWRGIWNWIAESDEIGVGSPQFQEADAATDRLELGGYLEATARLGRMALEGAARIDAAGSRTSVQPRVHARFAIGPRAELSAGVGRTSRLYHLLGEARSEPDFDFLDFWLDAGDSVPTATVDHATIDLNLDQSPIVARFSGYASRGSGIGEVRPEFDAAPRTFDFFRFGRSRTRGVEAQLALRGSDRSPHALSVSYSYSVSERDWGEGWLRWAQDRRHAVRVFGQYQLGRLTAFGAVDAASGMPATGLDYRFTRQVPGLNERQNMPVGADARVYGPENAVSTSGTIRLDGGINWTIGGRGRKRLVLGVGVINLLQTAVAPIALEGSGTLARDQQGQPTPFRRLFDLPGFPTVTLRAEW